MKETGKTGLDNQMARWPYEPEKSQQSPSAKEGVIAMAGLPTGISCCLSTQKFLIQWLKKSFQCFVAWNN
jgi:hypothetical protein